MHVESQEGLLPSPPLSSKKTENLPQKLNPFLFPRVYYGVGVKTYDLNQRSISPPSWSTRPANPSSHWQRSKALYWRWSGTYVKGPKKGGVCKNLYLQSWHPRQLQKRCIKESMHIYLTTHTHPPRKKTNKTKHRVLTRARTHRKPYYVCQLCLPMPLLIHTENNSVYSITPFSSMESKTRWEVLLKGTYPTSPCTRATIPYQDHNTRLF